tara:strand:+ start:259 stop:888 length:630 start_codon:yes stop_codon:yes gene_type:complete
LNINPFIGVAGNIGVGKTTFTEVVAEKFKWKPIYESVIDNPYLDDFYSDMDRWSFNLQIYFLNHRFSNQLKLESGEFGFIQDRTIYEDKEIFARNLYKLGFMSGRDWKSYSNLFINMVQFLKKPDLIVYLRAETDTLISRIKKRNRDFEREIDVEYLHALNIAYDKWINNINDINVLKVETDSFNIFKDKDYLNKIYNMIRSKLDEELY